MSVYPQFLVVWSIASDGRLTSEQDDEDTCSNFADCVHPTASYRKTQVAKHVTTFTKFTNQTHSGVRARALSREKTTKKQQQKGGLF